MTQQIKIPADTATALKAAKAAAVAKADRAPHRLTEAEVGLLPGKKVLELGNAGHLRHLGVGVKPVKPATPAVATPKGTAAQRSSQTAKVAKTTKSRTGRRK
jgi:hypothetical protein